MVVGGGGAGLFAAMELARADAGPVAIVSKLHPIRSHTGAAMGGIAAALGNTAPDSCEWHMFDTVKGGAYLADQDAAEVMCKEAPDVVIDLEHLGLPFDRLPDGRIAQRQYGGHTAGFGAAPVPRSCYAADRTGHMILHTLYQQCLRHDVEFFDEFQVVDLLIDDGRCRGVVAVELRTADLHVFAARAVVLATGGYGRIYDLTTNAVAATGDGPGLAFRAGIPLQDMEFFQFHPTGVPGQGILISEAARGMGGHLRNGRGERFMERYAPTLRELAPRDVVARAIHAEIAAGRGMGGDGGDDHVELHLTHLDPDELRRKLPDLVDHARTYLGIDASARPIPVLPRAHYAMGGIPTDVDGRVRAGTAGFVDGLYAAGECACVSVHGANRLGTNSLLDILVFGRRAGRHAAGYVAGCPAAVSRPGDALRAGAALNRLLRRGRTGARPPVAIRRDMQRWMGRHAGVSRNAGDLAALGDKLAGLAEEYADAVVHDRGKVFNQELLETTELGNMLDVARAVARAAAARTESRGSHFRSDHPETDDERWLRHTLVAKRPDGLEVDHLPVSVTRFPAGERTF
ncbi:succinate dehydrogenase flavoprotein subunit [Actinomadura sp. KC216]|nr:succinate dehydrogenase flavoprotein subunit [Actinomadura sp. KC216]